MMLPLSLLILPLLLLSPLPLADALTFSSRHSLLHRSRHHRLDIITGDAPPADRLSSARAIAMNVLRLLAPVGYGQPSLEESTDGSHYSVDVKKGRKRDMILDKQMTTHVFFILSIAVSSVNRVLELALLLTVTTILSFIYHRNYERPGKVALLEGFFAKSLFVYGAIQLPRAALTRGGTALLLLEVFLMVTTVATFLLTNLNRQLYEDFHCIMHIIPGLWSGLVGYYHLPLCF